MRRYLVLLLVLTVFSPVLTRAEGHWTPGNGPDSTLNLIDKAAIASKLVTVRDKMLLKDYRGALQLCREILTDDRNNATAHYRMAEGFYELHEYTAGMESLNKALASDPKVNKEADYLMAKLHLRLNNLKEAQEALNRYKATITEKQYKDNEVNLFEGYVLTATELMQKPVAVKVTEMGENINSPHDDYAPIMSPDGKIFYFVSRRPSQNNSNLTPDFKYFEDIYTSTRDESGNWQKGELLEGKINTEEFDNVNFISKDGTTMYITQNILRVTKSADIAIAKQSKSGKWNMGKVIKSKKFPVNTSYFEACPTLPETMDQMIFISERQGGKGSSDLWKVSMNNGAPTAIAVNLATLNTPYNETTPYITGDGLYLFFSSDGPGSMGGTDIFVSKFEGGNWSAPVNLGYPINSTDNDTHFKLSPDGTKAYISSIRKEGTGGMDIYEIDLTGFDWKSLFK